MQRGHRPGRRRSRAAHSRGTAPKPMARAAVAGNIDTTSPVAVKMMLMTSSSTSPLRSMSSASSSWTRSVDLLGGVGVDGGGPAQGSDGGARASAAHATAGARARRPAGRRAAGRARLGRGGRPRRPGPGPRPAVEGPPLARAQAVRSESGPIRVRTSRRTGWPTASHIRRTWRLRPSWMTMRSTPGPPPPPWPAPSSRRRARPPGAARRRAPGEGVPSTSARYSFSTP